MFFRHKALSHLNGHSVVHSHSMDSVFCSLTQSMKEDEGSVTLGSYPYSSKNENACVNYHNYHGVAHFFLFYPPHQSHLFNLRA